MLLSDKFMALTRSERKYRYTYLKASLSVKHSLVLLPSPSNSSSAISTPSDRVRRASYGFYKWFPLPTKAFFPYNEINHDLQRGNSLQGTYNLSSL